MPVFFPPALAAVPAAAGPISMWPLVVLGIGLVVMIFLITFLRLHAFLALILVAILTGVLAGPIAPEHLQELKDSGIKLKSQGYAAQAVELAVIGFGDAAEKMGVVIALAAIIGVCLVESGAAEKVVRRFLAALGERRAPHALFAAGFLLSIPIFFETYFMLLLPLAQALHLRTGRSYMTFVLAICCGGTITHSLVAPHPGPMQMADFLHLDVGQTMLCGILAGLIPVTCMWMLAQYIGRTVNAPMRDTSGVSHEELNAMMSKPESELPSLAAALAPLLLPLLLIGSASFAKVLHLHETAPAVFPWVEFFGDRHIALLFGALAAIALCMRQRRMTFLAVNKIIAPRFADAGVIILIASAGGAYGVMLGHAGVGKVAGALARHWELNLVFLGWAISTVIRVAQGSATVAMASTAAIMYPIIQDHRPPYHTIYIFLAIGFGSKMVSWMNDSGFWTVSKLSGFTEAETLKSWTILVTFGSLLGLTECLIFSKLLPFGG
jgi:GntP family gluconate:H+ symporter